MTDYWPDQEGRISDGYTCGFFRAGDITMVANNWVKTTASAAGYIGCVVTTTKGDCNLGMVLKTPVAVGDRVPVVTYGIVKSQCYSAGAITGVTAGSFCCNSGASHYTQEILQFTAGATAVAAVAGGLSFCLGLILQTLAADGDEGLILIGKCV